jgi:hypothetical protein
MIKASAVATESIGYSHSVTTAMLPAYLNTFAAVVAGAVKGNRERKTRRSARDALDLGHTQLNESIAEACCKPPHVTHLLSS